ncbi:hypothetical protein ACPV50_20240 [Vibrio astriarenae]
MELISSEIDSIRNASIKLESTDLELSHELMKLAYKNRPHGRVIAKKLNEYSNILGGESTLAAAGRLQNLVSLGEVVIVPVGFRCFTSTQIKNRLGITQKTYPFDYGFFSPQSIASVIKNPIVKLTINGFGQDHSVCIKDERYYSKNLGKGIEFSTSSYEDIDRMVLNEEGDVNCYLDSTLGYYTLCKEHQFILAHYNWHRLACNDFPDRVYDPAVNLKSISDTINRRIERMLSCIESSRHVFFIFGENQNFQYMKIDHDIYNINDFSYLNSVMNEKFGSKFTIIKNAFSREFTPELLLSNL